MTRKVNRTLTEIKDDINMSDSVLRDDIYDILLMSLKANRSKDEAIDDLRVFLNSLEGDVIKYHGDKDKGIDRIVDDIDSYGVEWPI